MPQVLDYIHKGWDVLTRSMQTCDTVIDKRAPEHSVLYLPAEYPESPAVKELTSRCKVGLQHLPKKIAAIGDFDYTKSFAQARSFCRIRTLCRADS